MNDIELFEQARRRVQNKIKGRCVTNKDVIVDQEKEILYYREKIRRLTNSKDNKFKHELEIKINNEEYIIKYNDNADSIVLNSYLVKMIYEEETYEITKGEQFSIINKTREEEHFTFTYGKEVIAPL